MHQLYRKILRDWKRLSRDKHSTCYIKPQESNLQFWNFLLLDDSLDLELYCVVFISHKAVNEWEPIILVNCLTPNPCIPVNKTLSLNHLYPFLLNQGLTSFYDHMSSLIFNRCINITDHNVRFAKAWNRLQVEEFKHCFPQLFANYRITQSDSQMVSEYLQTQGQVQNNAAKRIFPKLHFKSPAPVHTQDHTTNKDCSEQQFMGKRQRTSISSFTNVSPLSEPNSNIMENLEDCDFLDSRKRRR